MGKPATCTYLKRHAGTHGLWKHWEVSCFNCVRSNKISNICQKRAYRKIKNYVYRFQTGVKISRQAQSIIRSKKYRPSRLGPYRKLRRIFAERFEQTAIAKHDELLLMVRKWKLRWSGHISKSSGLATIILRLLLLLYCCFTSTINI